MCEVTDVCWLSFAVAVRQPAVVQIVGCDSGGWFCNHAIVRTTVFMQIIFPYNAPRRPAATPERDNPERRNEERWR
jgi:hypothetical protein